MFSPSRVLPPCAVWRVKQRCLVRWWVEEQCRYNITEAFSVRTGTERQEQWAHGWGAVEARRAVADSRVVAGWKRGVPGGRCHAMCKKAGVAAVGV